MLERIARGTTSTQTIKDRIKQKHGRGQIKVLSVFESWSKKMKFRCCKCKHEWEAKPQAVCEQTGCPECAWTKRRLNNSKAKRKIADKEKLIAWKKQYDKYLKLFPNLVPDKKNKPISMKSECYFECIDCDSQYIWTLNRIQNKLNLLKTNKSSNPHYCGCVNCMNNYRYKGSQAISIRQQNLQEKLKDRNIIVLDYKGISKTNTYKCINCNTKWSGLGKIEYINCPYCRPSGSGFSKIALFWLDEMEKLYKTKIIHAGNEGEYRIPNTRYKADGYSKELNTVFEFYGDAYHGNPDKFASRKITTPYSDKTAGQLYKETQEREKRIKALGYNVISVWENDYINSLVKRKIIKNKASKLPFKGQVGFQG